MGYEESLVQGAMTQDTEPVPDDMPGTSAPEVAANDVTQAAPQGEGPSRSRDASPPPGWQSQQEQGASYGASLNAGRFAVFSPDDLGLTPPDLPPPPPPPDSERLATDPEYARAYHSAVAAYSDLRAARAEMMAKRAEVVASIPAINEAAVSAIAPYVPQLLENQQALSEFTKLVNTARDVARSQGEYSALTQPGFWRALATEAIARAGMDPVPVRAQRHGSFASRPFASMGQRPTTPPQQYNLTDEEMEMARKFGLTPDEWVKNIREGT